MLEQILKTILILIFLLSCYMRDKEKRKSFGIKNISNMLNNANNEKFLNFIETCKLPFLFLPTW